MSPGRDCASTIAAGSAGLTVTLPDRAADPKPALLLSPHTRRRNRERLFADCRAGVRIFRFGAVALFCLAGCGRLFWPLLCGFLRVFIAAIGGSVALRMSGSLQWLFAALAVGLAVYGIALAVAIRSGVRGDNLDGSALPRLNCSLGLASCLI